MKLYLAGPMRGYPEFNHPAFHAAAAELRASGHAVFNPAEHAESLGINTTGMTGDPSHEELAGYSLRELIAADLAWICANAEAIALLPGWQDSLGAAAEVATAKALGIPVGYARDFLANPR